MKKINGFSILTIVFFVAMIFLISSVTFVLLLNKKNTAPNVPATPAPQNQVTPTPSDLNIQQNDCEYLKKEITNLLNEANYCQKDNECKIISLSCPFGCHNLVNRSHNLDSVDQKYLEFKKSCTSCIYDCDQAPTSQQIKCQDNKCVDTRDQNKE